VGGFNGFGKHNLSLESRGGGVSPLSYEEKVLERKKKKTGNVTEKGRKRKDTGKIGVKNIATCRRSKSTRARDKKGVWGENVLFGGGKSGFRKIYKPLAANVQYIHVYSTHLYCGLQS
jgi:hypothetical protein